MIVKQLKGHFDDWEHVTERTVGLRLMSVMRKHIGNKKAATKDELFKEVFGVDADAVSYLNYHALHRYISSGISLLRRTSNLFVVGKNEDGHRKYFVPESEDEGNIYTSQANVRIRGLNVLKRRVRTSVEEAWQKEEWVFDKSEKERE